MTKASCAHFKEADIWCRERLIKASDILAYEWGLYREYHSWLVDHPGEHGETVYRATVEAMLTHMRELIEFFYRGPGKGKYEGDIRLCHWPPLESPRFCSTKQENECLLECEKEHIDKLLAHLTTDRDLLCRHDWREDAAEALDGLLVDFVQLYHEHIGPGLQDMSHERKLALSSSGVLSTAANVGDVEDVRPDHREVI